MTTGIQKQRSQLGAEQLKHAARWLRDQDVNPTIDQEKFREAIDNKSPEGVLKQVDNDPEFVTVFNPLFADAKIDGRDECRDERRRKIVIHDVLVEMHDRGYAEELVNA